MNVAVRTTKQFLIALIIVGVLGFIGLRAASTISPATPTPTPDPHASLAALETVETTVLRVADLDYDVVAKIKNPNASYGSSRVRYELSLMDDAGKEILHNTGAFYILPGQTKYVLLSPLKTAEPVSKAALRISEVDWQQLDVLATRQVTFVVTGTQFIPASSKLRGSVLNNSDFDLAQADVTVVLLDALRRPVSANRTEIRTFLAKTTRGFEVSWSSPIIGSISSTYVEATTNLFENSTFLRTYGTQEQFQEN
ncbi:MAG: hypothetical protein AAB483_00800 [Patescibacteria group bacterium]